MKYINPIGVGSLTIRPNWRFEVLQNPNKYHLQDFCTVPANNAGCLKRFLTTGLTYEVNYTLPSYLQQYTAEMDSEQLEQFQRLWNIKFKRSKQKKISVSTNQALFTKSKVWNVKHIPFIQDAFLQRLLYHYSNIKHDRDIKYACDVYMSSDHDEVFKFIGYGIFAGLSDKQLAKRYTCKPSQMNAIRNMFFDFSRFPKDRVARFAYLRQLANVGLFNDTDFSFFKRIFELGELGLRAQVDFTSLSHEERLKVQEYLGSSIVANTLNVNFSIRSQRDAVVYGTMVSNLATYYINQKEATLVDAKVRNLNALTSRIESQNTPADGELTDLDMKFIDLIKSNSLQEPEAIQYKTLDMLKKTG